MGMAIGVENMTLKQVSNSLWHTNLNLRAALVLHLLLLNPWMKFPGPTTASKCVWVSYIEQILIYL